MIKGDLTYVNSRSAADSYDKAREAGSLELESFA